MYLKGPRPITRRGTKRRRAGAPTSWRQPRFAAFWPSAFQMLKAYWRWGCGTGHFTRWLRPQGLSAAGLDLSAVMLAEARSLNAIPLVRGDACRLPFSDGAFDLVALVTTLEFLGNPRQALTEALRVTQQGLLLGVLNRWSLLGMGHRLARLLRPSVYNAAHFYGVGELTRLVRSIAGRDAATEAHTTFFPRLYPWPQASLPWGGFVAMAAQLHETSRVG
jgi:hypothetical protein